MREMMRCLICGRSAWPTSYAKGQARGHERDTLVLIRSLGRGRGLHWKRTSRANDRNYLTMWRELLRFHLNRIEQELKRLGETLVETLNPEIVRQSIPVRHVHAYRQSPIVRQAPVILRG